MKTFLLRPSIIREAKHSLGVLGLLTLVITIPVTTLAVLNARNYVTKQKAATESGTLQNASFETTAQSNITAIYATGWWRGGDQHWGDPLFSVIDDSAAPSGSKILYMESRVTDSAVWARYEQGINLTAGTYTLSASVKPLFLNGRGVKIALACMEAGGCGEYDQTAWVGRIDFTNTGTWEAKSVDIDVPTDGIYNVWLFTEDGSEAYFDNISLAPELSDSCSVYGSAAECSSHSNDCAWYICANMCLEKGTSTDLVCGGNLVQNFSFEQTSTRQVPVTYATGWLRGGDQNWGDRLFSVIESDEATDGGKILYMESRVTDSAVWARYEQGINLTAGTYTLSASVKPLFLNGRGVKIALACMEANGCGSYDQTAWVGSLNFTSVGSWETKSVDIAVPVNGIYNVWLFTEDGSEAYFDDITLEEALPNPPICTIKGSFNAVVGQVAQYSATASVPLGGNADAEIDFNTSKSVTGLTRIAYSNCSNTDSTCSVSGSHTFDTAGTYYVFCKGYNDGLRECRPFPPFEYPADVDCGSMDYLTVTVAAGQANNGYSCNTSLWSCPSQPNCVVLGSSDTECYPTKAACDSACQAPAEDSVYIKSSMQGKASGNWDGPALLTIQMGGNSINAIDDYVVFEEPITLNAKGEAVFNLSDYAITAGISYKFYLKGYQQLSKKVTQVYTPGMTVDFGEMLAGDVYLPNEQGAQDGEVNSVDFAKIIEWLWSTAKDYYDLDGNGEINSVDMSLIIANWFKRDQ